MDLSAEGLRVTRARLRADLHRRASARRTAGCWDCDSTAAVLRSLGLRGRESEHPAALRDGGAAAEEEEEEGSGGDEAQAALCALVASSLLSESPFEPLDSAALHRRLSQGAQAAQYAQLGGAASLTAALRRLGEALELDEFAQRGEQRLMVLHVDPVRLGVFAAGGAAAGGAAQSERKRARSAVRPARPSRPRSGGDDLESLLSAPSFKERQARAEGAELMALLCRPTAREAAAAERFRSVGGPALKEYCPKLTRDACRRASRGPACERLHFVPLRLPHTDLALGDCSFLDTCRHMRTCKYVHYALDPEDAGLAAAAAARSGAATAAAPARVVAQPVADHLAAHPQPQWLNCDVRSFELSLLGQFGVIMADPPWDIHMDLPYGTMSDDEMRHMAIGSLQTEGLLFLWVTGRAMELGRECLSLWGYRHVQELVWVKTNQLQRIIRTGRTGHWLNHSKEHCLVGVKGAARCVNRHLDCDVLVAEVRETSRKPDEMYALLERLSPGTRKLEIFGREHNTRPGWVTLGNQLPGARLGDDNLRRRFLQRYPERAAEITLD